MANKIKLNERQKRFCQEYVKCGFAAEAYEKVYGKRTTRQVARSNASELLAKPHIKEYIKKFMDKIENENIASAEEILSYLTSVMRGEQEEVILQMIQPGVQDQRKIEVSSKERIKAAELLGKRYSLFTDRVNVEGGVSVIIADDLKEDEEENTDPK